MLWREGLCLVLTALSVRGYGTGAPLEACEDMMPQHGSDPQTSLSPYSVSAKSFGQQASVTVRAPPNNQFMGFFIQARLKRDPSRIVPGSFLQIPDGFSHLLNCTRRSNGDTITHSNNVPKNEFTTTWIPPKNFNEDIIFRATLLRDAHTFWVNQDSQPIRVTGASSSELPNQKPTSSSQGSDYYDGCSAVKGCMGYPQGCMADRSCQMLLSYYKTPRRTIQMELTGFDVSPGSYIAVGLSLDELMGDDSVTECVLSRDGLSSEIQQSWNSGHSNRPLNTKQGLSQMVQRYQDQVLNCKWERQLVTDVGTQTFDLANRRYYLLLARGPFQDGRIRRHSSRQASRFAVNLTENALVAGATVSPLIRTHGSLMVFAWLVLVNLGIILARHYKPLWENMNPCGVKVWFFFHRAFMVSAVGLVVVAVILIFVDKSGWSSTNSHTVIGILASVLAVLQPIMAIFRPSPTHPMTFIFNWGHLIVGNTAHLLAIVAIFLAADLPDTSFLSPGLYYPLAIYAAGFCFAHIMLHVALWAIQRRVGNEINMVDMAKGHPTGSGPEKVPAGNAFKKAFLFVYSTGMACIAIAIVVLIWVSN